MLYLIRYPDIGSEPHLKKSKLKTDILAVIDSKISGSTHWTDPGRIFLETDDPGAEQLLAGIHGITSFSPAKKCGLNDLEKVFLNLAIGILKNKKRFGVKVKRTGEHTLSSQEFSARLGSLVLKKLPGLKVDFKDPDELIFVEIRGQDCFIFNRIVAGIDRSAIPHPPSFPPQTEPRFIADDMLGKLARRLRMMGFDTLYPKTSADSLLVRISSQEGRIILTRDNGLAKIRGVNAMLIHSIRLGEQLKELMGSRKIKLAADRMFSRCAVCNTALIKVEKEKIKDRVPPLIYKIFDNFTYCPVCDKVYWKGTHYERMLSELEEIM